LRDHLAALVPLSDRLMAQIRQVAGASDVDSSEDPPQTEVRIAVNRNAASDLGLDLGTVASTMRGLVAGEVVSQFEDPDGDSYDVRLRVQRADRTRAIDLLGLDLPAQDGRALVPASQLVSLETGTAPSKVRLDLMREIRVSASTEGRSLGELIADIKSRAATLKVPTGYRIDYTGESEDMMESFLQPFAIMLSLPLSLSIGDYTPGWIRKTLRRRRTRKDIEHASAMKRASSEGASTKAANRARSCASRRQVQPRRTRPLSTSEPPGTLRPTCVPYPLEPTRSGTAAVGRGASLG
jgi:hypothetical protein